MKQARDICMETLGRVVAKHVGTAAVLHSVEDLARQKIASVDRLQASVLTSAQLDALARVQDAVEAMAKLQQSVNQLCTLHGLTVRRLGLFELGMLTKEIEDLVFASHLTESRLRAGGIPAGQRDADLSPAPAAVQRLVA